MGPNPTVGVTMGDPAGVGAEVAAKAYPRVRQTADVVVVGDADAMRDAVRVAGLDLAVRPVSSVAAAAFAPDAIPVLDHDNVDEVVYGDLRAAYGRASLDYIDRALDLVTGGRIDAMTTGPIHKQAIRMAGCEFSGHTGLLAARTGTERYAMLLLADALRVSHVSTHVPLRTACERVTTRRVREVISLTDEALCTLGVASPTIAVAGLNPHAGDGGLLGDEDAAEIGPAVEAARADGIDAEGPRSPDTVFARAAAGDYDCVVAMYHDQGHIPVKMEGFRADAVGGVNVTIGLPVVRTSVDHGTAFDIAGEGVASAESMVDAVEVAARMARRRDE